MKFFFLGLLVLLQTSCFKTEKDLPVSLSKHDLLFPDLAKSWDEGIPLGNGVIGALVWQKEERLRMSLDNIYLWDNRPREDLYGPEYKFSWVYEHWKNDTYKTVQDKFDVPYQKAVGPSKIPGAALEFNISNFGKVDSTRLSVTDAVTLVNWENGIQLKTFVNAAKNIGWFRFKGVAENFKPVLIPPAYNIETDSLAPVASNDLRLLGYEKGVINKSNNTISYTQKGWGDFKYKVSVSWVYNKGVLEGCWSISAHDQDTNQVGASNVVSEGMSRGIEADFATHKAWWKSFWSKSTITIPDQIIEKQWYLEQYKFGSAARNGSPPISLQAVWTADNGKLPPWKGDYHHDLNTQLSYWPSYSANHLDLEVGYLNWLISCKDTFKKYAKQYYESNGLAVPGVSSIKGAPMGGWIQYAFGPTVSGWLSQHFYLHWRYSMDKDFLKNKAYPWIKEVALFFNDISITNAKGLRQLPISASPEIYDNSKQAWFGETTNFDLAIIRWAYKKAAELATELGYLGEAQKWQNMLQQWPSYAIHETEGLMLAPEHRYKESHRHFSHLMAFHPLGLIDYSKGSSDKAIINNTINHLVATGSDYFTGYSFSWLANLQARAFNGEAAAETLRIFSENFCLPNSFHVNGEQHNKGYSKLKYRPFTLEGNFAFASAVQEMLIQSHSGTIQIFPAIPKHWSNVSFNSLRAEGAFLVSAKREQGKVTQVFIRSEKGGVLKLKNPFKNNNFTVNATYTLKNDVIHIETASQEQINIKLADN